MLSFITYKIAPEEVEIVADASGIDDLIHYLQGIKDGQDHMHLIMDSEINDYPIPSERRNQIVVVRQVRLEYADAAQWSK